MGKKIIQTQIFYRLSNFKSFGQSKRQDKQELREQLGTEYKFYSKTGKIYSDGTFKTYLKRCNAFAKWCVSQGVDSHAWLKDIRHLVEPFLQARTDAGLSAYTVKLERAALGLLYGEHIEHELPERKAENITRSRYEAKMDKHFSQNRNRELVTIARATGGRRKDLAKLKPEHFEERNGRLYVNFYKSKGGRNRISPVLPALEKDVRDILAKAEDREHERLFSHMHTKTDIHGFRRQYAQELYKVVSEDSSLRDEFLRQYPPRHESNVKSKYYATRTRAVNKTFLRDDLYIISVALGHNRLEVAVTNYLI